tara:strand:- start:3066 stop:4052 length:987 start_codon:yes stop_codon:yes gene_type:complete
MNYDERLEKYTRAMENLADEVNPILEKLMDKATDLAKKTIDIDMEVYTPPCGITKKTNPLTPEELDDLNSITEQTIADIVTNPADFPELAKQVEMSKSDAGQGKGSEVARVRIEKIPYPSWLDEIEDSIGEYLDRSKVRKGLDYEELVKGRISKARDSGVDDMNTLYIILDTSGSMWGTSLPNSQYTFLSVLVSYFPAIANKFSGQAWLVDDAPKGQPIPMQKIYELETFRGKDIEDAANSVTLSGGGGTSFWGAFEVFSGKLSEMRKINPDAQLTCVLMTDLFVDLETEKNLIPEDLIIVSTKMGVEYQGENIKNLTSGNRKIITIG